MFDPRATPLEAMAPGPELAGLLAADPAGLSGYDLVSFLGATERLTAWAQSQQLAAIRELARRRPAPLDPGDAGDVLPGGGVSEFAADEVAAELRISTGGAQARLHLALALDRLPGTRVALAAGRLDLAKTRAIAEATTVLDEAACLAVEARVLARAPGQTLGRLRASLARAVIAADPAAAQTRHQQAAGDRRVELWALPDGLAALYAQLPAADAIACHSWLTALAEHAKTPGDARTLDQRHADALADLAFTGLTDPALPKRHGRPVHLQVAVTAATLLGLDEAPAELAGYGPITAQVARTLAGDATWRRILTDPTTGAVRDVGTSTYRPPQHLAERVIARDKTCRAPGCRIPARRCELDHTRRFPDGPTADTNLSCGCKHHHRKKHQTDWQVEQLPDNTFTWTSPTGHTYRVPPQPFLDHPPPDPQPPPPQAAPGPEAETPPF